MTWVLGVYIHENVKQFSSDKAMKRFGHQWLLVPILTFLIIIYAVFKYYNGVQVFAIN